MILKEIEARQPERSVDSSNVTGKRRRMDTPLYQKIDRAHGLSTLEIRMSQFLIWFSETTLEFTNQNNI